MTVDYREQEPPAPASRLSELEARIARPLPGTYRDYLSEHDGGWLVDNDAAVKNVFGVGDVPDSANLWDVLDVYNGRIPIWLLPVADDEYGNLYCVSLRDEDAGTVWFWNHEEESDEGDSPTEDNIVRKGDTWPQFLNDLRPAE